MGKVKLSEWLWRFLATVMLFTVGWSMWIFYQLNPTPLVTNAAFEAAAKAKANAQNAQGVISPPAGSGAPAVAATVPASNAAASPAAVTESPKEPPKEPPVNVDKLKFSESITAPAPDAKQ